MMTPAGPFRVEYEDRGNYLYARVSGERDSAAVSLAYWREIAGETRRRGQRLAFVIESFQTAATMLDTFQVAEQLPSILHGLIVAFVDEHTEHFEENRFGEDVAVNRGAIARVFRSEELALEWLKTQ